MGGGTLGFIQILLLWICKGEDILFLFKKFWLHWVFVAGRRLLSSCGMQAPAREGSRGRGLSSCGAQA